MGVASKNNHIKANFSSLHVGEFRYITNVDVIPVSVTLRVKKLSLLL